MHKAWQRITLAAWKNESSLLFEIDLTMDSKEEVYDSDMEEAPQVSDPQKPNTKGKYNLRPQNQDLKMQWLETDEAWVCTLCQKRCWSSAARNKHKKKDCLNQQPQNPSWKMGWNKVTMGCRYCGQIFSKRKGIRKHLQSKLCPKLPDWNQVYGRAPQPAANKEPQNRKKQKKKKKQTKKKEKSKPGTAPPRPAKVDEESDSSDEFDGEEGWKNPLKDQPAHGIWREHQQEAWSGSGGSHHQPEPLGHGTQSGQPQTSWGDRQPPQFPGHNSHDQYSTQAGAHMPPQESGAGPMSNPITGAAGFPPTGSGAYPRQAARSTDWAKEGAAHAGSRAGNRREETGPAWSEQETRQRPESGYSRYQYDQYYGQGDGGCNYPDNRQSQGSHSRVPPSDDYRSRSAGLYQEGSSQRRGYPARSRSPVRDTGRETVNAQDRGAGYRTRYFYPSKPGQERNQVSEHHKDNYQTSTQDPRDYRRGDYRGSQDRGYRGYPADRGSGRYPY